MFNPKDYDVVGCDTDYECTKRMKLVAHLYKERGLKYYGEKGGRPVYQGADGYFRIDRFTLNGVTYIALEWCENVDGGYEDSELIPSDASYDEVCKSVGYMF